MIQFKFAILTMIVIATMTCFTITAGQSGFNEEGVVNTTAQAVGCVDDSPQWVEHQYKIHLHGNGKTHLHIGVNVSLKEAVLNDGSLFKQLLLKRHQYYLTEEGKCREGDHITHHAQYHGQVCPWEYRCDYNPRRVPAYVYQAQCSREYWLAVDRTLHKCREVYYPVTTLHTEECNPVETTTSWEWRVEMVAVACA